MRADVVYSDVHRFAHRKDLKDLLKNVDLTNKILLQNNIYNVFFKQITDYNTHYIIGKNFFRTTLKMSTNKPST